MFCMGRAERGPREDDDGDEERESHDGGEDATTAEVRIEPSCGHRRFGQALDPAPEVIRLELRLLPLLQSLLPALTHRWPLRAVREASCALGTGGPAPSAVRPPSAPRS